MPAFANFPHHETHASTQEFAEGLVWLQDSGGQGCAVIRVPVSVRPISSKSLLGRIGSPSEDNLGGASFNWMGLCC
eukprot:1144576-Pelagomonas_calceolata.AAC.2